MSTQVIMRGSCQVNHVVAFSFYRSNLHALPHYPPDSVRPTYPRQRLLSRLPIASAVLRHLCTFCGSRQGLSLNF
ncbi:hypothetical protein ACKVWM_011750 [Pyricularia oryzae]